MPLRINNHQPTNIVHSIPLTNQTDPRKFVGYEHEEYPKMLVQIADKAYVERWMEDNQKTDDRTGKPYWPGGRPIAEKSIVSVLDDVGNAVIAHDEDEEAELRAIYPHAVDPQEQERAKAEKVGRLEGENAELRRRLAELQRAAGVVTETAPTSVEPSAEDTGGARVASLVGGEKKGGWPKGKPRKPAERPELPADMVGTE